MCVCVVRVWCGSLLGPFYNVHLEESKLEIHTVGGLVVLYTN